MHHIQDTALAILPAGIGVFAALESTNLILKVLFGGLSVIYITVKLIIALKEYKKIK